MSGKRDRNGRAGCAAALHPTHFEAFVTMTLNQILTNPLDGETPASRLKQVALIMVIGKLQGDELPITLTRLIEITGLTRGGVGQAVGPLVQRGLLIEEMGKNAMGRGMARQFNLSPTFLETLGLINGNPIRHAK